VVVSFIPRGGVVSFCSKKEGRSFWLVEGEAGGRSRGTGGGETPTLTLPLFFSFRVAPRVLQVRVHARPLLVLLFSSCCCCCFV
jgi:hypothetical protein